MNKQALADLLIERLNEIASHDLEALHQLIETRVPCNEALANHPTVQVQKAADGNGYVVGILGLLNGLVGAMDDGPKKGWGFVAASYDEDKLVKFMRTPVDPGPV